MTNGGVFGGSFELMASSGSSRGGFSGGVPQAVVLSSAALPTSGAAAGGERCPWLTAERRRYSGAAWGGRGRLGI